MAAADNSVGKLVFPTVSAIIRQQFCFVFTVRENEKTKLYFTVSNFFLAVGREGKLLKQIYIPHKPKQHETIASV